MEIPLVVDPNDYRWQLIAKILKISNSRKSKQIVAIYTQTRATAVMKIVLTSMFFSTTISHVVEELRRRRELRELLGINKVPKESYLYSFLSRFDLNDFTALNVLLVGVVVAMGFRKKRCCGGWLRCDVVRTLKAK